MGAYLHNVYYELGEVDSIESLPDIEEDEFLQEILVDNGNGFKNYLFYENTALEFTESILKKFIHEQEIDPLEIDLIIFASDSFTNIPNRMVKIGGLLNELNFSNAYPLLMGMSECSNLQMALSMANAYASQRIYNKILVVALDLVSSVSPLSRIVQPGIAVMSDAASCCLVSSELQGDGWEILSTSQKTHPLILERKLNRKEDLALRVQSHKDLFDALFLDDNTITRNDIIKVFSSNFLPSVLSVILSNCGFKNDQLFLDNIPKFGHCLVSDCLINLKDYQELEPFNDKDKVILYGEGTSQWGSILLEYNQNEK